MYLFDKKGNNVLVYDLKPDEEALKKYRTQEMKGAFSMEEMFYCAHTNSEPILETRDELKLSEINFDAYGEYHKFELDKNKSMVEICHFLSNYLNGEYTDRRVVQLINDNEETIKYLLIISDYLIKYYPSFNRKRMHHILSIPKSLYLLQQLQQQNFDALKNENIDKQLSLFSLTDEPVDQFIYSDFINNEKTYEVIESSQPILQRKLELNQKKS